MPALGREPAQGMRATLVRLAKSVSNDGWPDDPIPARPEGERRYFFARAAVPFLLLPLV